MAERNSGSLGWIDVLFLILLVGLALLSPIREIHKQLTLLAIGVFQLLEGPLLARLPKRGRAYSILIKILLATLLIDHTGDIGINSAYYPIYYLPVLTAAIYYGTLGTVLWTGATSLAYCSFLIPALQEYELTRDGLTVLFTRIAFFFLAAILVNRFVIENKKQVHRYQALSEQLTETNRELQKVQAEARRSERLAALGQLSAGLAHEIRNPLAIIKGSAEMLTQKLRDSKPLEGELASYISSEVNRLNGLVSRFLDFARPSNLDRRRIAITSVLDQALDAVHNRYPEAPIVVEKSYAEDLPKVQADQQMCEQVFVNLIMNAYEAMMDRIKETTDEAAGRTTSIPPPKLQVTALPYVSDGQSGVVVEVQDSGPGIPREIREQIFNPFVTSKKTGVGLGLSIVAKIVDDHRGTIQLKDTLGEGACFRVFLPS